MLTAVLIFLLALVLDITWAFYIRRTAEGRYWQAGLLAAGTVALGGVSAYLFIHQLWLLVPDMLGAFVGTTTSVYRDARQRVSK